MAKVKVLHMADLHLEWPFAAMGADRHRGRLRREELKDAFVRIIDLAAHERSDLLLIAGDLFEHTHATRGVMQFIDQQFRRIPGAHIFISPGNHDPYVDGSYYQTYPWAPNVHIFGPEPERVDLPDLPVSVYGWGFGAWEVRSFQLAGIRVADPGRINLLLCHGGEEPYHPIPLTDLAEIGADYIALGHIHKEGVFLEQDGRAVARYPGSPEALGFGEPGQHGVLIGTVSKAETCLSFAPIGRRRYISAPVDVDGAVSLEDIVRSILAVDSPALCAQHCYRLTLTGAVDPELTVDLPLLQEKVAEAFYFVKLEDQTHPDHDLARLSMERTARGLFVQRLVSLEAMESDPVVRRRIRRALALGMAAFEGKGGAR